MSRRNRSQGDAWQSYADLAMGLMAMLTLILLILLAKQHQTSVLLEEAKKSSDNELVAVKAERSAIEEARRRLEEELVTVQGERERLEKLRTGLELERAAFALELEELFDLTFSLVARQDSAEAWVSSLFEEADCRLAVGPSGNLEIVDKDRRQRQSAGLYDSGATGLSHEGQEALTSCRDAFLRLAYCLAPEPLAPEAAPSFTERKAVCAGHNPPDPETLRRLSIGIEALALEGSTDRIPYGATPGIIGAGGRVRLSPLSESFASNAYLGAERARQAMGFLVGLVQDRNADPYDAHEVLLSRLSVETTSFGRYQAGPQEWREPGCDTSDNCNAARNLNLRLRWRKSELRAPLETIRSRVCKLVLDPSSALAQGLKSANVDPGELATRLKCEPEKGSNAP